MIIGSTILIKVNLNPPPFLTQAKLTSSQSLVLELKNNVKPPPPPPNPISLSF